MIYLKQLTNIYHKRIRELKKRGFQYLGSITAYSHLQACGMINDHEQTCFRYRKLLKQDLADV